MDARTPIDHGGSGRKKNRPRRTPKGRQTDPAALDEVRALLGDRPRRRDLLIEHLHLIQDRYGHLSAAHLAALAAEMKLAQTEVYEVATFYAHFDVVKEGEIPPPPVTVRVCDSLSCAMAGAEHLLGASAGEARPRRARGARALHGRVRSRAGLRRRPCAGDAGGRGEHASRPRAQERARACAQAAGRSRGISRTGRLHAARRMPLGQAHARGDHQGGRRCRPARPRRRRLSHRAQVDPGAAIARAAPDGGERRRGRARHVQGPLLSGPRSAPLHRGHADRRLGGRGGRHLCLHPRRISRTDPDAARGIFPHRRGRPLAARDASICAAAPAPTSAAKSPR